MHSRQDSVVESSVNARVRPSLGGLIAAPFTPFRRDGEVNLATIPRQARMLAHNAVAGAFVCGTTGEGDSLTVAERRRVAEAWLSARPAGLAVIVHVGQASAAEAAGLAQHAAEVGADAIGARAPSSLKGAGAQALVDWCARIAEAAPELPFYYYHIPSVTGLTTPVVEFLEQAAGRIPTLAGVKFTHENLMDYTLSARFAGGRYNILFGRDEMLLTGLVFGARGAVGSTYNYLAPLYHDLIADHEAGRDTAARARQEQVMRIVRLLHRHGGGVVAGKVAMKLAGLDCGPVRLPLRSLTDAEAAQLRAGLEQEGFFKCCSRQPPDA